MTATTDDSQEKHGEKEVDRSFWSSFSRGDARLFVVTFAGTVAANVVTVMVVAIALILDRPPIGGRATPFAVLGALELAALAAVLAWTAWFIFRHDKRGTSGGGAFMLVCTVVTGLVALLLLLVLLGYAVGVK